MTHRITDFKKRWLSVLEAQRKLHKGWCDIVPFLEALEGNHRDEHAAFASSKIIPPYETRNCPEPDYRATPLESKSRWGFDSPFNGHVDCFAQ